MISIFRKLVNSSDNFMNNSMIYKILSLILIVPNMLNYSPKMTKHIVSISHNMLFQLFIYLLIGYVAQTNIKLSIFMIIALLVSYNIIIKYEFNQYILDIIIKDQQNKNELNIKKKNKKTTKSMRKESNSRSITSSTSINNTQMRPIQSVQQVQSAQPNLSAQSIQIKSIDSYETYNDNNADGNFSYL